MKPTVGILGTGIYIPPLRMSAKDISERTQGVWTEEAVIQKLGILQKEFPSKFTYLRFENCGHSPLVDKPDLLTDAVVSFIQP